MKSFVLITALVLSPFFVAADEVCPSLRLQPGKKYMICRNDLQVADGIEIFVTGIFESMKPLLGCYRGPSGDKAEMVDMSTPETVCQEFEMKENFQPDISTVHKFTKTITNKCRKEELETPEEIFAFPNGLGEGADFHMGDPLNYGEAFDSYLGLSAYGNREDGGQFQCTELAHRFIRRIYGFPSRIGLGLGNGKDVAANIATHFARKVGKVNFDFGRGQKLRLKYFKNECGTQPPMPGSIVSFDWGAEGAHDFGHVAVVKQAVQVTDDMALLNLFQQGGFATRVRPALVIFRKNEQGLWFGDFVVGWTSPLKIK